MVTKVLEIPGIDEMIEAQRKFDIGLIRDAANPLARPVKLVTNIFTGLFPQDDQTNTLAALVATVAIS